MGLALRVQGYGASGIEGCRVVALGFSVCLMLILMVFRGMTFGA